MTSFMIQNIDPLGGELDLEVTVIQFFAVAMDLENFWGNREYSLGGGMRKPNSLGGKVASSTRYTKWSDEEWYQPYIKINK